MKVRSVVGLAVLVGLFVVGWYVYHRVNENPGEAVGLAIGHPHEGEIELHLVISMAMVRAEGPRTAKNSGAELWEEWIADHFDLRDSSGTKLSMQKAGWSDLIGQGQAMNPEFFLTGKLKIGGSYTLKYIPRTTGRAKFQYSFTAPGSAQTFQRVFFKPE